MKWRRSSAVVSTDLQSPAVHFDNLAIVPANLLPYKARYQALANTLPRGQILIILPASDSQTKTTLQKTAELIRATGRSVTTLSSKR
jgi:hypothetical protein